MPFETTQPTRTVTIRYGSSQTQVERDPEKIVRESIRIAEENGIRQFNLKIGDRVIGDQEELAEELENNSSDTIEIIPVQKGA